MKSFSFDSQEQSAIIWLSIAFTILLIFWHLFGEEISALIILTHAIFFFAAMLVAVFLHEVGHKLAAKQIGYRARTIRFTGGLIASIILAFYTFARIPIITPNLLALDADPRKRLDRRRTYDNPTQQAIIAASGVLGSLIAITLMRALAVLTGYELFITAQFGAALHAVYSLIPFELLAIIKLKFVNNLKPITPSDGLYIIRASYLAWGSIFSFTVFFAVLSFIPGVATLLLAIGLMVVTVFAYKHLLKK